MLRYLAAYLATAVAFVLIDAVWLGLVAKSTYTQGIGHLMAVQPNLVAAAAFYTLYPFGVMIFAVAPEGVSAGWLKTFAAGAMLGFFAYGTYDLTNLATLKDWPIGLAILDMAWGALLTGVSALAGKAALDQMAKSGF